MKHCKVQIAHGAAVELNHDDQIVWNDICFGLTLDQALKEVEDAVYMRKNSDLDEFEQSYYDVLDEFANFNRESLYREMFAEHELKFKVEGREVAWRIIED